MRSTSIPFKDVILTSDRLLDTKVVLVNPTTKEEIRAITSENIIDYKIEESLFSDDFEIGTTICSKLNINFLNLSETEAELRGYTLRVYLGLNINGETEYVELKDYYIDEIVVEKNKYSITAYDYMLKLDNEADLSEITGSYPDETEINYQDFIDFILSKNNTSIGFNGVDFNFSISLADIKKLKGYTYRQILTAIAGINACYISIATKDKLKIFKIDELEEKNVVKEIDGSAYFSYKQNNYLDIQTTKGSADGTIFITKGEGQQIYSFENQLLKDEHMNHIHNTLKKIKFYGYSLDFVGDFSLELGDIIKIITVEGIEQIVPITSINLTYKGSLRVLLESNIKTEDKLVENLTQGQKLEKAIDNVYAEFENGFGKGITKINADGIEVSHSAIKTKTLLSADGFRVLNAENEPIAWFSTEKDFAEIKATTVNADNITNIYTGLSTVYIDHSKTVAGDGSYEKPYTSFTEAMDDIKHNGTIINKTLNINVLSKNVAELLDVRGFSGAGAIYVIFNSKFDSTEGIKVGECTIPIYLRGNEGVLRNIDKTYTIEIANCHFVEVREFNSVGQGSNISNHFVYSSRSKVFIQNNDFSKYNGGVFAANCSNVHISNNIGSEVQNTLRCYSGSTGVINGTHPDGLGQPIYNPNGITASYSLVPAATEYVVAELPTDSSYLKSWNSTGYGSYIYPSGYWQNLVHQGAYSKGNSMGFFTFDDSDIRTWLSVADVNRISINIAREKVGANKPLDIYVAGYSSNVINSGTPNLKSNVYKIGTLDWGERKTFTIPLEIGQGFKNGTIKSICFYDETKTNTLRLVPSCKLNIRFTKK